MITAILILQGIVMLLWTYTMFRTLFHLRRRGASASGFPFPGPVTFLRTLRDWLRDPAERAWRWRLAALTVLLITLSAMVPLAGAG